MDNYFYIFKYALLYRSNNFVDPNYPIKHSYIFTGKIFEKISIKPKGY